MKSTLLYSLFFGLLTVACASFGMQNRQDYMKARFALYSQVQKMTNFSYFENQPFEQKTSENIIGRRIFVRRKPTSYKQHLRQARYPQYFLSSDMMFMNVICADGTLLTVPSYQAAIAAQQAPQN